MPWWGWVIIAVLAVVGLPIKLKILKKMAAKRQSEENNEDF